MRKQAGSEAVGLSASLRPVYEAIRAHLSGTGREDVRARRKVGVLIDEVKRGEGKYGARAVEQLARALGTNVHTLYRCASVSECWSEAELEALLTQRTPRGGPLSWSHLVTLAGVEVAWSRQELTALTVREGLSVRDVLGLVEATEAKGARRGGPAVVARRVVRRAERWSEGAGVMHDELLAQLERASGRDEELAELLEKAIEAEERLHGVVEGQLVRLRAEYARLVRSALAREERPSRVRVAGGKRA